MRIISTKKLIEYYTKHPDCKSAIIYWIEIVKRAIEEPLRQIVNNAGKEGAVVVQKALRV